jgi:hypothetical protein
MEVVDLIFCKNEDRQPSRSGSCVLRVCHVSIARVEGVYDSIFCKDEDRQPGSGSCVLRACYVSIARIEGVHDRRPFIVIRNERATEI